MPFINDHCQRTLHAAYDVFAPLFKQDITLNFKYGILSGAILWSVRDAEDDPIQHACLEPTCSADQLVLLLKVVRGWDILDPLGAARAINKRAMDNLELRGALDAVLAYWREDMLNYRIIKQLADSASSISVAGDVNGSNVVIGGYQYVAGDLIIQYITPKAERLCPKPPAPPAHFGGRDVVLQSLKDKIKRGEMVALTAINGAGGIGKTTLARMLAHQMYTDKVFWAVLWADVTRSPDAIGILRGWATGYADSSFSTENLKEDQIVTVVKALLDSVISEQCELCEPSRVLVVLDDVWDNGLDAARLIQKACPENATVLITTRSEQLANSLHAHQEPLGYLEPKDAAALLTKYLPAADADALQTLGMALGGHALALELTARRIENEAGRPGQTLESAVIRAVVDYQRGIPAGTLFADLKLEPGEKREDNLTKALALSYDDLKPLEQKRFRALGVLAYDAPFDQIILAALWETTAEKVDDLADALRLLSLIQPDAGGYRQHPLLRSYALGLLTQAGEAEDTFACYADQLISIARKFTELPPEQWGELTSYLVHIQSVGAGLVARTQAGTSSIESTLLKRAQLFAIYTRPCLSNHREVRQIDWTEMGLTVSRQLEDVPNETRFLNDLGTVYAALGNNKRAFDYYAQALSLFRTVSDRSGEASTLTNIGAVYAALGDKVRALNYYAQALSLFCAVGDRRGEAITLNNLGLVYAALENNTRALGCFEQALPLFGAVSDHRGEATTLTNIGAVYSALEDKAQALDYYAQALSLFRVVGNRSGEASTLNNLGRVYAALGDNARALGYFEQALRLLRAVGNRSGEAGTLNNLGLAYAELGDNARALGYFEQALLLSCAVGDCSGEGCICDNMAHIFEELGELDKAIKYAEHSANLLQHIKDGYAGTAQANLERLRNKQARIVASQTLPEKTIQNLAGNTIAVKTSVPDRLDEWRIQLQAFRDAAATKDASWQMEVAFMNALIAVLNDQSSALSDDNPYQFYLNQVLLAIDDFKIGTNS